MAEAAAALDHERFGDAQRTAEQLLKQIPGVAAVHEVLGLAAYGQGQWKAASDHLEQARRLGPDVALLPVLADAYRAQHRWSDVDSTWAEIQAASPSHETMTEGRIVAAATLADRGQIEDGIKLLESVAAPPQRIREHHLRQWYVLGDLYDRAGDQLAAVGWFRLVSAQDSEFADVRERLRLLGR